MDFTMAITSSSASAVSLIYTNKNIYKEINVKTYKTEIPMYNLYIGKQGEQLLKRGGHSASLDRTKMQRVK